MIRNAITDGCIGLSKFFAWLSQILLITAARRVFNDLLNNSDGANKK